MAASLAAPVFVDTGAWIALAVTTDPLHRRAAETWDGLLRDGARAVTSVPVVLETFTFLERNAAREVALRWKDALATVPFFRLLECGVRDLKAAWSFFDRRDLHKLSAVDATSFVIMKREKIRRAFTFDHHFAKVGFQVVG
jgi:predicted nucleic acid-binding protein